MKKHSIGNRIMSLLLVAALLLPMVPVIGTSAASIDAEWDLGNIMLLNNDESITLPIKVNNFAMDGMMFEYLSNISNTRNSQFYLYEPGGVYQLFTLHLAGLKVGVDKNGNLADRDGLIQPDSDAMSGVNTTHSLTSPSGTASENYKGVTSGGTQYSATMVPYEKTDGGGAMYLEMRQYDRDSYAASPRIWRKLTRFSAPKTMDQSRYAVIIYRVNGDTYYDNMLLTWGSYDELPDKSNCSQTVPVIKNVDKTANAQWQYAIIDLAYNLGGTEEERAAAAAATTIEDLYLKAPLNYFADGYKTGHTHNGVSHPATYNTMDLAAVAYFPYYGDAEQFVHYGLTLGCQQQYYHRDNRGFDFLNATRTSGNNNSVSSVSQWDDNHFGNQLHTITTTNSFTLQDSGTTGDGVINTLEELSYAIYGEIKGYATMGLLESQLDENGRPVYREVVVDFVAAYLRNRLTAVAEYPADNYGWKNYSFVTGVSTTSEVDEHLFGKDANGRSIDLATALCNCVSGAKKGGGAASGTVGTYNQTRAKASELIGTWNECKGNIETWYDAAYFLLHNLYVTDEDTAYDGDGYGEYEDDFRNLIMQQINYKDANGNVTNAYAFDSGFAIDNVYNSAVIYNRDNHILSIDGNANVTGGMDPFLPSSGTGTETGEANCPYYSDELTIQHGRGYRQRDYHFTISGNGFFQFEEGLFFEFKGDDDVYLFINGQLVLDIGGTHSATLSKINLDDYVSWAWAVKKGTIQYKGLDYTQLSSADRARVDALALEEGGVYTFDFFYMERHGAGSNLRIVTNIQVTAEGLNVDKTAYQNGDVIADNGMVDVNAPIEYSFKITNDTVDKFNRLTFQDSIIGVSMDYQNGLVISPEYIPHVRNATGNPLTVADLQIYVTGKDAEGNDRNVVVTCNNNEELKSFLNNLTSDDGTQSGDGLWPGASVQIRGIYYTMTDAQKEIGSFRNYVSATADAGGFILRGADDHTVYQPGKPAYYQWVGHPVVIERERLYKDLCNGVVESAADLPALGNMILVPSDADGVERQDNGLVNTRGGDIYLKANYTTSGTYVAYVTIRDKTDSSYRLTVPITIYATNAKDSVIVLDYGLDSNLTDNGAIFEYELDMAVGEGVTGTLMGIAPEGISPDYKEYDVGSIETAIGNTENPLTLVNGTYADTLFTNAQFQLDSPIFLDHTKPWVIEFEVGNLKYSSCLFSLEDTREVDGNLQLYLHKSGSVGHIVLGSYSAADGRNNNYGVQSSRMLNQMTHVKLYNVPAGDGSNMVYCSIDGNAGVAMTNVYLDATQQGTSTSTWLSGKDFTFKYMGCKGSPYSYNLQMNMKYLRVYEEGEQLVHYRWEYNAENDYINVPTEKTGYEDNAATYAGYTYNNAQRNRWELSNNVVLNSDHAWEIEFGMQLTQTNTNLMLFSSTESKVNGTNYVYIVPSKRLVAMGSNDGGTYVNYGVVLPNDFDMTAAHTYLLKNRVNADGTNMVYLYVDKDEKGVWTEVGALNYYSNESNIGVQSTGLSGMDFSFKYIGGYSGFGLTNQVISYIEVHEDTALRTAYEWAAQATEFANVNATSDGNRIVFEKDASGVITVGDGTFTLDGTTLKFETSSFLDRELTIYVAMTIHDKDFTPTALNQAGVDVSKEVQMFKKVSVVPANVVYYEDDFPAIHYVGGNSNVFTPSGTGTLNQLQSPAQDTEYGSDAFYQNSSSTTSGNHVTKITVREDDSDLAWFGFKGTGFELISSTSATDSAMLYIEVYSKNDVTITGDSVSVHDGATELAWIPLSPEFNHENNGDDEVIHQVPIIRWQRQDDDSTAVNEALNPVEYVVIINGYATIDFTNGGQPIDTYLYIDGIRIFQPMGYANNSYPDRENKVLFDEVRDLIIDGKMMACEKTDVGVVINSGTVTWTENYNGLDYTGVSFEGKKVNNVNDYLLKGPNNEVYMAYMDETMGEDSSTASALSFVVYRNADEAYQGKDLELQIGVRAIDSGNFFGTGSSGMKANLQLGVVDANGIKSWISLASVTSGTEQYISIPYQYCPVTITEGVIEYNVVIRVSAFAEGVPAMVSFSSIKHTEGLELKPGIGEALDIEQDSNGQWVTSEGANPAAIQYPVVRSILMANHTIARNEAVRGENFAVNVVIPENEPAILPQYPSLSFEGEVQYNIYYTLQNLDDIPLEDMGLITFDTENVDGTIADATDVISGALFNGTQYAVHTNGIPARNLGDTLYFKVYAKLADGSYVYSSMYSYSAKQYAQQQLAGTRDEVKPLVVAMLNYGAAAQEYFGYETDDLMNAELAAEEKALVRDYDSDVVTDIVPADSNKAKQFVNNGGFLGAYPTVSFEGAFAINYYANPAYSLDGDMTLYCWNADTYNSVGELTAENASCSKKMISSEDVDSYFAQYAGIAAKEIGDTIYVSMVYESEGVTYCSGVIAYSLGRYCKGLAEDPASPAQNLASATAVYGYYAQSYFGD